jgi:hypothetical protein
MGANVFYESGERINGLDVHFPLEKLCVYHGSYLTGRRVLYYENIDLPSSLRELTADSHVFSNFCFWRVVFEQFKYLLFVSRPRAIAAHHVPMLRQSVDFGRWSAGGAQTDPRDDSRVPHPFVFGF